MPRKKLVSSKRPLPQLIFRIAKVLRQVIEDYGDQELAICDEEGTVIGYYIPRDQRHQLAEPSLPAKLMQRSSERDRFLPAEEATERLMARMSERAP